MYKNMQNSRKFCRMISIIKFNGNILFIMNDLQQNNNNVHMNQLPNILRLFDGNKLNYCRQNKSITSNSSTTNEKSQVLPDSHASNISSHVYASEYAASLLKSVSQKNHRAPLAERDQNKPLNKQRTKYDINRLGGSQSFKYSIIQKTSQSSNTQSEQILQFQVIKSGMSNNIQQRQVRITKNLNRKEVQSVIFDSKAVKMNHIFDQMLKYYESKSQGQTSIFSQKIKEVNNQIDSGICHLSRMVKQLRVLHLQKKIIAKQNRCKIQIEQNKEVQKVQQQSYSNRQQECMFEEQELRQQEADTMEMEPTASKIGLMGNFSNEQAAISQEYTTFVNRLAHQILLDIEFTQKASQYSKNGTLSTIKTFIIKLLGNQSNKINQTFFDIDPFEIDPLQKKSTSNEQLTESDLQIQASKLQNKYQEIEGHFRSRLRGAFSSSIISLLFDQLSSKGSEKRKESVTVGDLLSYLNMRTSNTFRNRYFVKMMKRLNLNPNGSIKISALQVFTTPLSEKMISSN